MLLPTMDFPSLLIDLWRELREPDIVWQSVALLLCLGVAAGIARRMKRRSVSVVLAWRIGQAGLQRLAFPLVALLLVAAVQQMLKQWMHTRLLALAISLLLSLAVIRAVFYVLRHVFKDSGALASFERVFALLVWALVALHITGLLPDLIAMIESVSFPVGKQKLNLWMVLQGLVTVLVTLFVALWLASLVEARLAGARDLDANLRVVFSRLAKVTLIVLAVLIGLPLVGIDLTTLSVFGGALGVGLGFGLQKIASNYVSGFIILLDRSIRIGNLISVGSERGQVTQITTRYTVLKNFAGVEAIVPNENLIGSVVLNESFSDPRISVALAVQVAYDSDVEQALSLLCSAAAAQPRVLADPPPKAFLAAFKDSGLDLELYFWIADPEKGTLQVRSDINRAILSTFAAAAIAIPYPQREVRLIGAKE